MWRAPAFRNVLFVALVVLPPQAGWAAIRDFQAPDERIVDGTAYTLTHRQMRIDLGLVGLGDNDLGANLGLAYGIGDLVQLGLNLAHVSAGILNFGAKVNLVNCRWWGLGLSLGVRWVNGDWLWLLKDSTRETVGGVDIVDIPIKLIGSFPVLPWMGLHLTLAYSHSEVFGELAGEEAMLDATAGVRQITLEPVVRFYLWRRLALTVGMRVAVFARAAVRGATESLAEPDLIVGVQGGGWKGIPLGDLASYYGGLEWRFGAYTHLQLFLTHGPLSRVLDIPVLPSLNIHWRF